MNNAQVIATYETILSITEQMLEAAKRKDWDHLQSLEIDCKAAIASILAVNPDPLTGEYQQRKVEIIHKMLADDAEIRNITQPWMANLDNLMTHSGQEDQLN
jgi:flagellar protein FliT